MYHNHRSSRGYCTDTPVLLLLLRSEGDRSEIAAAQTGAVFFASAKQIKAIVLLNKQRYYGLLCVSVSRLNDKIMFVVRGYTVLCVYRLFAHKHSFHKTKIIDVEFVIFADISGFPV